MAKAVTTRKSAPAFNKTGLLAAVAASVMIKPARLTIKELDADVLIRRITIGERDQYFIDMAEVSKNGGKGNTEAFIYAAANEDNTPMFTLDDYDIVKDLPAELVLPVINEFNIVNRFIVKVPEKTDDGEEPEDEDLKNS